MKLASVAVRTVADRAVVQAVATELSSAAVHSPEESIRKAGLLGVGALFSDPDVLDVLPSDRVGCLRYWDKCSQNGATRTSSSRSLISR